MIEAVKTMTPGPWREVPTSFGPEKTMLVNDQGTIVIDPYGPNPQDRALIAAAPDLYDIVAYLVSQEQKAYVFSRETLAKMRSVLAKAEGREAR